MDEEKTDRLDAYMAALLKESPLSSEELAEQTHALWEQDQARTIQFRNVKRGLLLLAACFIVIAFLFPAYMAKGHAPLVAWMPPTVTVHSTRSEAVNVGAIEALCDQFQTQVKIAYLAKIEHLEKPKRWRLETAVDVKANTLGLEVRVVEGPESWSLSRSYDDVMALDDGLIRLESEILMELLSREE